MKHTNTYKYVEGVLCSLLALVLEVKSSRYPDTLHLLISTIASVSTQPLFVRNLFSIDMVTFL